MSVSAGSRPLLLAAIGQEQTSAAYIDGRY